MFLWWKNVRKLKWKIVRPLDWLYWSRNCTHTAFGMLPFHVLSPLLSHQLYFMYEVGVSARTGQNGTVFNGKQRLCLCQCCFIGILFPKIHPSTWRNNVKRAQRWVGSSQETWLDHDRKFQEQNKWCLAEVTGCFLTCDDRSTWFLLPARWSTQQWFISDWRNAPLNFSLYLRRAASFLRSCFSQRPVMRSSWNEIALKCFQQLLV